MIAYQQSTRPVQLHTPLGDDAFTVLSYEGEESVSGLFHVRVDLRSADPAIDFTQLIGQGLCLSVGRPDGTPRLIHGVCAAFAQTGVDAGAVLYSAELRPWLWLLTMSADCRIFQNLSTPDMLRQVFSGLGLQDFEDRLTATYAPREYCVQYNETAFDFVSRLMEEDGIFYFFEHSTSHHKLILADSSNAWTNTASPATVTLAAPHMDWKREDAIASCVLEQRVTVGEVATTDFNFETPSTSLAAHTTGASASRSRFSYPGLYSVQQTGETATGRALEAYEVESRRLTGRGSSRHLQAGASFTLAGHPRADANTTYVTRRLRLRGTQTTFENHFDAFPASAPFRPPAITRRPVIAGTQTATVTGKAGEEIWTDKYGRVKVKFHWDQTPAKDENSSCWVRVAQGWAGKTWGTFFLPRIGQEVVVTFLDGNPDRPLITGSVYNAEQIVPYALPGAQTQSTIKSATTPGGGGSNELRFEDKKGSEEVYLHAQKDMKVEVIQDQAITLTKGNRTLSVSKGNETYTINGTRTIEVGGNETRTNKADYTTEVKGAYHLKVTGNLVIEAGGSVTIKAGSSLSTKAGTTIEHDAGTNLTNKACVNLTNEAGAELTSKASAQQTIDGGGMVVVKGGLIKLN